MSSDGESNKNVRRRGIKRSVKTYASDSSTSSSEREETLFVEQAENVNFNETQSFKQKIVIFSLTNKWKTSQKVEQVVPNRLENLTSTQTIALPNDRSSEEWHRIDYSNMQTHYQVTSINERPLNPAQSKQSLTPPSAERQESIEVPPDKAFVRTRSIRNKNNTHKSKDFWDEQFVPPIQEKFDAIKPARPKFNWYTWAISRSLPDHKRFVTVSLRELLIFCLFLLFITCVGVGSVHLYGNIYCQVVMNVFTKTLYSTNASITAITSNTSTYYSIKRIDDVWTYLHHHFLNVLYFYNIEERLSLNLPKEDPILVLFQNIIVGPPRIRQVRVRSDSCKVPDMLTAWFQNCFDYFTVSAEDIEKFGPGDGPAWYWQKDTGVSSYTGIISKYSAGGYHIDFSRSYNKTSNKLLDLQRSQWIDRATRAVFVDFTTYSPNTNLFTIFKLVMEMPPGGGVLPTASCYSMESIRFFDFHGVILIILELLLLLFVAYFVFIIVMDHKYLGWPYMFTFWGILDVTIVLLMFVLIITTIIKEIFTAIKLPPLVQNIDTDKHGSFDELVEWQKWYDALFGIIVIICWIKLLKFLYMSTTVALLFTTIGKSKFRLIGLAVMGIILLIGFSIAAHLFFGIYIEEFNSIGGSMFTLLSLPMGGLYFFKELQFNSPVLTPLFMMLFILIFPIVLFSLCIAILVYGLDRAEEKRFLTAPKWKYGFYEYMMHITRALLIKFRCEHFVKKLKIKEELIYLKKQHELIVSLLTRYGLTGAELELFLHKHRIEEGLEASDEQLYRMYADLKTKQLLFEEVKKHKELLKDTDNLQTKLESLEKSLSALSKQVDDLFDNTFTTKAKKSI